MNIAWQVSLFWYGLIGFVVFIGLATARKPDDCNGFEHLMFSLIFGAFWPLPLGLMLGELLDKL